MTASISSIGTAVPENKIDQEVTAHFMADHIAKTETDRKKIRLLYRATGIHSRYSVINDFTVSPKDFTFFPKSKDLSPFPTTNDRLKLYEHGALELALAASKNCLSQTLVKLSELTHLITVSCTGFYAPGLDIGLVQRLGLSHSIERTNIGFMGCQAAINALRIGDSIIRADPNSRVLIVAVELCTIHLQSGTDDDSLLSAALFGDGAAAVLLECPGKKNQLNIEGFHSELALHANDQMSWKIGDHGFRMTLSNKVSKTIQKGIESLTLKLLGRFNLTIPMVDHFAIHPGGKKILEAVQVGIDLPKARCAHSYQVLRDYGNISSPSILFVLQSIWKSIENPQSHGTILCFAFGPGLSIEGMLLKSNYA